MKFNQVSEELRKYEVAFLEFVKAHELPAEWFNRPDHFAIKCTDELDYRETCNAFSGYANEDGVWELPLDGRFLASAQLTSRIPLSGYQFKWVEIMQPRPGKETEKGFVEHTEFLFADFAAAEALLKQSGIQYELQENPGHKWVNIVIDEDGREIKLNDKLLANVVMWEREQGLLHKIGAKT